MLVLLLLLAVVVLVKTQWGPLGGHGGGATQVLRRGGGGSVVIVVVGLGFDIPRPHHDDSSCERRGEDGPTTAPAAAAPGPATQNNTDCLVLGVTSRTKGVIKSTSPNRQHHQ